MKFKNLPGLRPIKPTDMSPKKAYEIKAFFENYIVTGNKKYIKKYNASVLKAALYYLSMYSSTDMLTNTPEGKQVLNEMEKRMAELEDRQEKRWYHQPLWVGVICTGLTGFISLLIAIFILNHQRTELLKFPVTLKTPGNDNEIIVSYTPKGDTIEYPIIFKERDNDPVRIDWWYWYPEKIRLLNRIKELESVNKEILETSPKVKEQFK
ncbi:MAG: hypothetical protein HQ575_04190 [Candidatus Omnitrophica bacterium]|nr:hypothetical protein [Candidatus Omnitrophota bacterium]